MNKVPSTSQRIATIGGYADIRGGIVEIVNAARVSAASNVNVLITASYWEIGRCMVEAELKGKLRAGYGEQLKQSRDVARQRDGRWSTACNEEVSGMG